MLSKLQFQHAIFKGLGMACNETYKFTGRVATKVKPEYLLTVNVARGLCSINDNRTGYGYEIIIKFEEKTKKFATSCVPEGVRKDIFDSTFRTIHNTDRNGFVDIAVYHEDGETPICPIELKNFHPRKKLVLKDLKRNLQFLEMKDKATGDSVVKFTFFACLEENNNNDTESNRQKALIKVQKHYEKMVKGFKSELKNISLSIKVKTIKETDIDSLIPGDDASDFHHFIGVLIILESLRN